MRIYQYLILTLAVFSAVFLQSCYDPNEDPPCSDTRYETRNFSTADLSKVPYSGFDTLYFLNKQGDTCIVRGTGKQFTRETEEMFGNPACGNPAYRYSNPLYSIEFVSVKGNLSFQLLHKHTPRRIYIDRGESYSVEFDTESNSVGLKYTDNPYYIDSLIINKMKYGRIKICLPRIKNEYEQYDTTYTLLYNQSNGILFIKSTKENEEFSIIPKP